jgi:preprotein translocase subunit YajC
MPALLAAIPLLFAQNAPAAKPGGAPSNMMDYLPYVMVLGLWGYFLILRPQQQQERKRKDMISALKKNDKVVTTGGLYGTVVSVDGDDDRVVLRVDDDRGVKLTFSKSAVGRVLESSTEKSPVGSVNEKA